MSQGAAALSRHDLEAKIVKRCWENEAFRKEFTADPAACFAKYLNAPQAQLPKISIHEEPPGSWHIVLPAKPAKTGELSDDELEKVAGGTDIIMGTIGVSVFVAAVIAATVASSVGVAAESGVQSGW